MASGVERALQALRLIACEPLTSSDLAVRLGVDESTVSRLFKTLEHERFVKRDPDRRLRLGPALFALAYEALDDIEIRRVASGHLLQLNALTGHTIHLGEFEAGEVLYIDKIESRRPLRIHSRIGRSAPLHCTGISKAIVAFLPKATQRMLASELVYTPHTAQTITSPVEYLAELRLTRERGYATDMGEHWPEIRCIAAPIRQADSSVRHSVSISMPAADGERITDLVPLLLKTTALISGELGWQAGAGTAEVAAAMSDACGCLVPWWSSPGHSDAVFELPELSKSSPLAGPRAPRTGVVDDAIGVASGGFCFRPTVPCSPTSCAEEMLA